MTTCRECGEPIERPQYHLNNPDWCHRCWMTSYVCRSNYKALEVRLREDPDSKTVEVAPVVDRALGLIAASRA
jgi:hypothetical protein